jgi:hypothetical protein
MKTTQIQATGVALLALVVLYLLTATALAQELDYTLDWWTVDGGGHTFSEGGGYALGGTIGQPDAGVMAGDPYTLQGGFWPGGAAAVEYTVYLYLPLTLRNY